MSLSLEIGTGEENLPSDSNPQVQAVSSTNDDSSSLSKELHALSRIIHLNSHSENSKFKKNKISTTRYSYWNFLLLSLLEQFKRVANCYFLFVAIISTIPGLSPTGPYTAFLPIVVVVVIGMFKEGIEDVVRRKLDNVTNHRKAMVYAKDSNEVVQVQWQDIVCGDVVKVSNGEQMPCDLLLLSVSHKDGLCFVETSNLDGETNLKVKLCNTDILKYFKKHEGNVDGMKGRVECELPNNKIYSFEGKFVDEENKISALGIDQLCLRGSVLRNTDYIVGLAVYTGPDTKIAMSSKKTPKKTTRVEKLTNRFILFILLVEFILILAGTIGLMIWTKIFSPTTWYLQMLAPGQSSIDDGEVVFIGFKSFWTIFILINNMIPISLYITLEFTKFFQGRMIQKDLKMYDEETDAPVIARSLLHEDLGQVNIIFSDKTGTLTENKMNCVKLSIGGELFGVPNGNSEGEKDNTVDHNSFLDQKRLLSGFWTQRDDQAIILDFLLLLTSCNAVIVEDREEGLLYHALSPDEIALVKTAKLLGVELVKRTPNEIVVKIMEEERVFHILDVIEFTSERKRQSVIIRDSISNEITLYTKGADSVIFPIFQPKLLETELCRITSEHVKAMGMEGLRTLVCAKAKLREDYFQEWHSKYEHAKSSLLNRNEKVEKLGEEMEQHLEHVLGATGIEDKLQERVEETIKQLRKAGIKIWVLTGDKQETALNIGFSSGLFESNMHLNIVEGNTKEELEKYLGQLAPTEHSGLIIDGEQVKTILNDNNLSAQFLIHSIKCKSVVCSRISPKQKADIVKLVKDRVEPCVSLAIGDGANDCSMIQTAHIGCGIIGREGMQASNIADYAFVKFAHLQRLLLVHGRWSYRRVSKVLLLCFYKNSLFYLTQLWFLFHNGFSGTSFQDRWNIALFNTVFTFLQIIIHAIFDKDIEDFAIERYPELYKQGHTNRFYNFPVFTGWILNAVFQSAVCFYVPYFGLGNSTLPDGQTIDLQTIGMVSYICILCVLTIKLSLETSRWNWIVTVTYFGTLLGYMVFFMFYTTIYYAIGFPHPVLEDSSYALQSYRIFGCAQFWAVFFLTLVVCCMRDVFWKFWIRLFTRYKLYYEIQKIGKDGFETIDSNPQDLNLHEHEEGPLMQIKQQNWLEERILKLKKNSFFKNN